MNFKKLFLSLYMLSAFFNSNAENGHVIDFDRIGVTVFVPRILTASDAEIFNTFLSVTALSHINETHDAPLAEDELKRLVRKNANLMKSKPHLTQPVFKRWIEETFAYQEPGAAFAA